MSEPVRDEYGRRGCPRSAGWIARLLLLCALGCTAPKWMTRQHCVLDPGSTRDQIVEHLNRNIIGTDTREGLVSWRSGNLRIRVDGVPMALPASIAVEAPRNFRLVVSNPISGGQEVDIGSNQERFWIWSKESPQIMTTRHEDVALALQELEMPVHIHPDWLMEVFGVIPIDPSEFELVRPKVETGEVELVARRQSPLGEDVERVIRVRVCQGQIIEHALRLPGGKVLARARLANYTTLTGGTELPLLITLEWPDARMQMVMDIRNPEINTISVAGNARLWQIPRNAPVVDIGAIARRSAQREMATPVIHEEQTAPAGRVRLSGTITADPADIPAEKGVQTASEAATGDGLPDWARPRGPDGVRR